MADMDVQMGGGGVGGSAPPRGYDVAALRKQMTAEFAAKFNDVELRKWCVEQAIKAGGSVDTTDAAKAIYVFVTANINEPSAAAAPE